MEKNKRLHPAWYDTHVYGLKKLKKELEYVVEKYLSKFDKDAEILDYGCGTLPYRELYTKYIPNYLGADITINPLRAFDLDIETSRINVEGGRFDAVISTQVLEHVISPNDYLAEAGRVTKKNGLLILSTHGFFPFHPDPNDYWRWTKSGLHKTLTNNGWQPIETIGIIGYTAAALSLFQYSLSDRLPKFFKIPFEVIMQRCVGFVDSFYTPQGRQENAVIYLIVAKKND